MSNLKSQDSRDFSMAESIYATAYSPAVMVEKCRALDIDAEYLKQRHAVGVRLSDGLNGKRRYAIFPWPQGNRPVTVDA